MRSRSHHTVHACLYVTVNVLGVRAHVPDVDAKVVAVLERVVLLPLAHEQQPRRVTRHHHVDGVVVELQQHNSHVIQSVAVTCQVLIAPVNVIIRRLQRMSDVIIQSPS